MVAATVAAPGRRDGGRQVAEIDFDDVGRRRQLLGWHA
jgi:hypothetical protein